MLHGYGESDDGSVVIEIIPCPDPEDKLVCKLV
jgi:hypothetical protein